VDYRTAYLLVGEAVRQASREGLRGVDVTGEMLDDAAEKTAGRRLGLTGTDLADVLDPRAIVSTRTLPGGAAPGIVRQMATDCTAAASGIRGQADEAARKIGMAEAALLSLAREAAGD
jgi:argininosuccinate lyase